jgi:hypothetical protein
VAALDAATAARYARNDALCAANIVPDVSVKSFPHCLQRKRRRPLARRDEYASKPPQ